MMAVWDALIEKSDLRKVEIRAAADPETLALGDGEVLLAVESFSMSANNVTYGAIGDAFGYFKDKDDILAAVRTNGFNRFSEVMEQAYDGAEGGRAKGAAVGEAYLNFAFEHPHSYKLMFDLNQPHETDYPELMAAAHRARATQTHWVKALINEGVLAGDPDDIGQMFWAATHGAVGLELAGKIPKGAARTLHRDLNHALARGLRG